MSTVNTVINPVSKKFAVLIGINYYNTANQLNGCINDVNNIKSFLINKCGYRNENMLVLTDNGTDIRPTRQNIIDSFVTLINKAVNEQFTELWFSYSGHGSYVSDVNGDEKDGKDEVICPVDFNTSGFIIDDYIYSDLICKLPKEANLFCLMDCCHSGTICDLPYIYDTALTTNNSNNKHVANIYSISGCKDNQTSADAYINKSYEGAMTWSFLKVLQESNYNISLLDLIKQMRSALASNFSQIPLLALTDSAHINDVFIGSSVEPIMQTNTNNTKIITFTMTVDYWFYESKWNVWSDNKNSYVFSKDNTFLISNQTTNTSLSLTPGLYRLRIWDTYGDGGVTSLVKDGNTVLVSSKLTYGKYAEYQFTI